MAIHLNDYEKFYNDILTTEEVAVLNTSISNRILPVIADVQMSYIRNL